MAKFKKSRLYTFVLIATLIGATVITMRLALAQPPLPSEVMIRGYVAARVGDTQHPDPSLPLRDIYLPGTKIFMRAAEGGATSDAVIADLSGRFTIQGLKPGEYEICYEAFGSVTGCSGRVFLTRWFTNVGTVRVDLPRKADVAIVYGKVTMRDGTSARRLQPFANINAFARVSILDRSLQVLRTADVNTFDEYLVPDIPIRTDLLLRTEIEGSQHDQPLFLESPALNQPVDAAVDNYPPRLEPLVAVDGTGRRVKTASPGAVVTVRASASDPDGDPISYRWLLDDGAGVINSTSAPEVQWSLPTKPGTYALTLYAYDRKGGYAESVLPLPTARHGIIFTGIVDATDAPQIVGAQVEINGRVTQTDGRGFFELTVADAQQFVMNIRKPGYGLVSRIYDGGVPGGRWTLPRGNLFRGIDPTKDIDLQHDRSQGDCPGSASRLLDWKTYSKLAEPVFQDGKGNIVPRPASVGRLPGLPTDSDQRPCGPGIRVHIPANALVDSTGQSPAGAVDVTLSTVDVSSPGQMPGDDTVLLPNGDPRSMEIFGAGTVEIMAAGRRYNLRSGMSAEITVPVDRTQLATGRVLPASVPLLSYNERNGAWQPEGLANLVGAGAGAAYLAPARHFSAVNMDNLKTNQACVRVLSPTAPPNNMPSQYRLEITLEQAGSAPIVRTVDVDDNTSVQEHVLYNLPTNTNMVLIPIRKNDPDTQKNNIPMGVFVVNTGASQNPTTPNRPVGPHYTACATEITLTDFGIQFYPASPIDGAFLHGLYSFAATNLTETDPGVPGGSEATPAVLDTVTGNYYNQIDPRQLRQTLPCFKAANGLPLKSGEVCNIVPGFTPPPTRTEVTAAYANTADLGFGREMHCVRDLADVACYVTNYGQYTPPGTGGDEAKAQEAVNGLTGAGPASPIATVAMEHTRIEDQAASASTPVSYSDPERVVKFFVYDAAGNIARKANLDLRGARPIPQLCMVCHGGEYPGGQTVGAPTFTTRNEVKLNSKFLPFDLRNFSYASPPFDKGGQQTKFKALNDMAAAAPPSDPKDPLNTVIQDLVTGWYASSPPSGPIQNENFILSDWSADALHQGAYRDTIGKACRTCHVTNADSQLRFNTVAGFNTKLGSVQLRVCKQHVMPHARRTHDLFWTSVGPNQAAQLQAYGDTVHVGGWQKVGDPGYDPNTICANAFVAGGATPPGSFYVTKIQGIWNTNCSGCHSPSNARAGLNLDPSVSYGQLVGHPATELATMSRVASGGGTTAINNSYLDYKLHGTQSTVLGSGVQMPQFSAPLGSADLNNIETWISSGANP
jgi:hypothetical protein